MLLRDLNAVMVWRDVAAWMFDRSQHLPSGADATARRVLNGETMVAGEKDAAAGDADIDDAAAEELLETVAEPTS
jgi:hypothetical protein